ncbi:MAG: DNA helicase [Armatimonas sp.]
MKLSAPIYLLKQQARVLARRENIPLHQALDRIARQEGFTAWSLLTARTTSEKPATALLAQLCPGNLVLLGARPGQGKTLLSLDLAIQALRQGNQAAFFTLDFTEADVTAHFKTLGAERSEFRDRFLVDDSDRICADYVIARLGSPAPGTLVVIDYLQLLDQRRENPDLMHQVQRLRSFAKERQVIIVCLSQIDRSYDSARNPCPGIADIRLPNPVDLTLFDRMCFLHQGKIQLVSPGYSDS